MRKALQGVIKTESQKKVLAQYSVGDGKGPRGGTEMSGWTKALLRNTQGKSRCQITACVYIPASQVISRCSKLEMKSNLFCYSLLL